MSSQHDYTGWRILRCAECGLLAKIYRVDGECEHCGHQNAPGDR